MLLEKQHFLRLRPATTAAEVGTSVAIEGGMNNSIDCTLDVAELAAAIAERLGSAQAASLHSPWDNEVGKLYIDEQELPFIDPSDILVTVSRKWGELNGAWAARIAAAFEAAI